MWEGFTTGLANTAGTLGAGASDLFGGLGKFLTSKEGQGLLKTGFEGFGALQNYNLGNTQMDIAKQQAGQQNQAFQQDTANAEARRNLRF